MLLCSCFFCLICTCLLVFGDLLRMQAMLSLIELVLLFPHHVMVELCYLCMHVRIHRIALRCKFVIHSPRCVNRWDLCVSMCLWGWNRRAKMCMPHLLLFTHPWDF